MNEVPVLPTSPAGKMLGLSAATYFNERSVAIISEFSKVLRVSGRCPPNVFTQLIKLTEKAIKDQSGE